MLGYRPRFTGGISYRALSMAIPIYYVLPFFCAVVAAFATMLLKRAMDGGVGLTRLLFVSNWVTFLLLLPLWVLGEGPFPWERIYWPVITSIVAMGGLVFTFLSLRIGEVSVVTPMAGIKVLFVALFSFFLVSEKVRGSWWTGAALTVIAIYLLGGSGVVFRRKNAYAILAAFAGAACFGLGDVLIQRWSADFGFFRYIVISSGLIAVESFALMPFFHAPLRAVPSKSWRWLITGTVFLSLQWLALAYCFSVYGKATAINIIYGSRGLWSVLLVWMIGPLLGNTEKNVGRNIMLRRLAGAVLLCLAIALVIFDGATNPS